MEGHNYKERGSKDKNFADRNYIVIITDFLIDLRGLVPEPSHRRPTRVCMGSRFFRTSKL